MSGAAGIEGTIYLLHFERRYRHAGHYTGWTTDLDQRLAEHAAGQGARLLAVVKAAGITWTLAATCSGTRSDERARKRRGGAARWCPVCRKSRRTRAGVVIRLPGDVSGRYCFSLWQPVLRAVERRQAIHPRRLSPRMLRRWRRADLAHQRRRDADAPGRQRRQLYRDRVRADRSADPPPCDHGGPARSARRRHRR